MCLQGSGKRLCHYHKNIDLSLYLPFLYGGIVPVLKLCLRLDHVARFALENKLSAISTVLEEVLNIYVYFCVIYILPCPAPKLPKQCTTNKHI